MKKIALMFLLLPFQVMGQWNNPHEATLSSNTRFSSFSGQPKTLDPGKSYSANEYQFIAQIYEPLLQYDYFSRPYKLVSLTTDGDIQVRYYDKDNLTFYCKQMYHKL